MLYTHPVSDECRAAADGHTDCPTCSGCGCICHGPSLPDGYPLPPTMPTADQEN